MELAELKKLWIQYDNRISENTRINKEVLKTIIKSKTENKINWIKLKAIFNLLIPIPMIIYIIIDVEYRMEADFFIGCILFGICFTITYIWAVKYYTLIDKIDFLNPITKIKNDINRLEKFKLKITKITFIIAPFFIIGIFLFAGIPFFSKKMILFYSLMLLVAILSLYLKKKYGIFEQLKKINSEIDEIEKLEQE